MRAHQSEEILISSLTKLYYDWKNKKQSFQDPSRERHTNDKAIRICFHNLFNVVTKWLLLIPIRKSKISQRGFIRLQIFWRKEVQNNIYFFYVIRKHFYICFALYSANLTRMFFMLPGSFLIEQELKGHMVKLIDSQRPFHPTNWCQPTVGPWFPCPD